MNLFGNSLFDPAFRGLKDILAKLPSAFLSLLFGVLLVYIGTWLAEIFLSLFRLPKGLKSILVSLIRSLLWILLIIVLLKSLGLSAAALVFSGSIAVLGLAVASGASSFAGDVIAGIFLSQDRHFNIGDEIRAGEEKTEGIVESMDMRRTRIRAKDGKLHVIPNSIIERKEWVLLAKRADLK